eukprot:scaffold44840_cov176-Amphora_coffeaeformis.AAC.2
MASDKVPATTNTAPNMMMMNSSAEWPPASLAASDVENIRQLTESLEAAGSVDPVTLQMQMAALLFLGDTTACRHLWRRHAANTDVRLVLEPWWKVAASMMTVDEGGTTVWHALGALGNSDEGSIIPVAQYAQDIAHAYRMRILYPFVVQHQTVPSFLVSLLGFGSMAELETFCQQYFGNSNNNNNTKKETTGLSMNQQAALLAFLEAQLAL